MTVLIDFHYSFQSNMSKLQIKIGFISDYIKNCSFQVKYRMEAQFIVQIF